MKTIDLFAGAGGLTEGFKHSGFESVFCNEYEPNAVDTLKRNHKDIWVSGESIVGIDSKEIRAKLGFKKGELDVLIGGPPCQGFSTYGKRDSDDPRNQLYLQYIKFLDEFKPKAFVIENVMGLLSMSKGAVLEDILCRVKKLGYEAEVFVLNAADFGVPQFRKRVFIIGNSVKAQIIEPMPSHGEVSKSNTQTSFLTNELLPYITVKDAISDLQKVQSLLPKETHQDIAYGRIKPKSEYQKLMRVKSSELSHHSCKQMMGIRRLRLALLNEGEYGSEIVKRAENEGLPYEVIDEILSGGHGIRSHKGCRKQDIEKEEKLRKLLHEGNHSINEILQTIDSGGFKNKYRRLEWEKPSHTLVAHMSRDCSDFVHPSLDRFISVREAARLQSFSDDYRFMGSQFQQFLQIGNAVPPLLAKTIGDTIKKTLYDTEKNTELKIA